MKSLSSYLDELKRVQSLDTDVEIGATLGVTKQHISQIRSGHHMGEEKCYELAKLLKREPIELMSLNRAIRSKSRPVKDYWLKIHEHARRTGVLKAIK